MWQTAVGIVWVAFSIIYWLRFWGAGAVRCLIRGFIIRVDLAPSLGFLIFTLLILPLSQILWLLGGSCFSIYCVGSGWGVWCLFSIKCHYLSEKSWPSCSRFVSHLQCWALFLILPIMLNYYANWGGGIFICVQLLDTGLDGAEIVGKLWHLLLN